MSYILDKESVLKNLNDINVRMVDCRFSLAEPKKGRMDYGLAHLPGAVFFDLEEDLSGTVGVHGGRHPLPNIAELTEKLEQAGIDEKTVIVAYDNGEGPFAARFWWLLQYLGHEKVFVLDGGYRGWSAANYPVTTDIPSFEKTEFHVNIRSEWIATSGYVREVVRNKPKNVILIDSREEKRYLGIEEPVDKVAGHIPGAINKPWMEGMGDGHFKIVEEQKQRFAGIGSEKQLIVYCGSGVTAVPNFLTLKEVGFEKVMLYVGSFSDWISYEENEIE